MAWEYGVLAEELDANGVTTRTWATSVESTRHMHAARDTPSRVTVLNERGREGWELVGFEMAGMAAVSRYLFKRPTTDNA